MPTLSFSNGAIRDPTLPDPIRPTGRPTLKTPLFWFICRFPRERASELRVFLFEEGFPEEAIIHVVLHEGKVVGWGLEFRYLY